MKEQLVIGIGEVLWDIFPEKKLQIMGVDNVMSDFEKFRG